MKRLFLISAASLGLLFSDSASGGVSEKGASDGKASIQSVDSAGIRHTVKGYVPMKAAPGSKTFAAAPSIKEIKLPRTVDLRSKMTKVEDQGRTSSCVANAVAGAYEYWTRLALNQDYDVSRLFIYYNARWRNGDQDKDEGSYIQFAMQGLKEFGACPEKAWPFEKPLLLKKPNGDAYEQASQVKVKEMQQVPLELEAWLLRRDIPSYLVAGCLTPSMNVPGAAALCRCPIRKIWPVPRTAATQCAPSDTRRKSRFSSFGIPGAISGATRVTATCPTTT